MHVQGCDMESLRHRVGPLRHQVIVRQVRILARRAAQLGDDGTNDLVVSEVLRTNELQTWFLSEHLVNVPLVKAERPAVDTGTA
jgi:starvation-inducible DNA-binding protein